MEVIVNGTTISVAETDITDLDVDAIVNAANATLRMGGGVAGAIRRRGGSAIEEEALRQGPIRPGEAVLTGGGTLPARFVIHAATMGPDLVTGEPVIRQAVASALSLAAGRHLTSVAIPALGTGVGGFALERAAAIIVEEIIRHVRGGTSLREIRLTVRGADAREAFAWAVRQQTTT